MERQDQAEIQQLKEKLYRMLESNPQRFNERGHWIPGHHARPDNEALAEGRIRSRGTMGKRVITRPNPEPQPTPQPIRGRYGYLLQKREPEPPAPHEVLGMNLTDGEMATLVGLDVRCRRRDSGSTRCHWSPVQRRGLW